MMIPLRECIRLQNPAGPPSLSTRNIIVNANHIVTMIDYSDNSHPEANSCITVSVGDSKKMLYVVESLNQIENSMSTKELLNG